MPTIEKLRESINIEEAKFLIKFREAAAKQNQMDQMLMKDRLEFQRLQHKLDDKKININEISDDQLRDLSKPPVQSFIPQSPNVSQDIYTNFAKQFGKENIIENDRLHFPDDPDNVKADSFFKSQADEGHAFLFQKGNSDHYAFSDGKGNYKMGSKEEIVSYCKEQNPPAADPFKEEKTPKQDDTSEPSMRHQ